MSRNDNGLFSGLHPLRFFQKNQLPLAATSGPTAAPGRAPCWSGLAGLRLKEDPCGALRRHCLEAERRTHHCRLPQAQPPGV